MPRRVRVVPEHAARASGRLLQGRSARTEHITTDGLFHIEPVNGDDGQVVSMELPQQMGAQVKAIADDQRRDALLVPILAGCDGTVVHDAERSASAGVCTVFAGWLGLTANAN